MPINFEDTRGMQVGTMLYQATGWKDNQPTSWAEFMVTAIHKNSIDVVHVNAVWGRNLRLNRSDFPLVYWRM